ncbi:flagellar biosynthetic protein FliR [Herbaspirillum seropedicae]|uniref:flagellar biosynthetic protein FliR n=1 Tax=Herbaspirillum seropedicae TaxID=964 RepID=UPI003D98D913
MAHAIFPSALGILPTLIDPAWVATVLLVATRLAAALLMTPVLYAFPMPNVVRVLLILAFAIHFVLAFPNMRAQEVFEPAAMAVSVLGELMLGSIIGLSILLAFAAFSVAGALLDVQIGYGMAQVVDPATRRPIPILTSLFNQVAVVVFFLVNGHHALLRGLAYSFERFPAGQPWPFAQAVAPLVRQIAGLFSIGFALAAPVVFCILLVEVGLGVLARNLPQMNMFTMGIPIKVIVGLTALSLWIAGAGDAMSRVYFSIFKAWEDFFAGAA